jgi:hypothetical protein
MCGFKDIYELYRKCSQSVVSTESDLHRHAVLQSPGASRLVSYFKNPICSVSNQMLRRLSRPHRLRVTPSLVLTRFIYSKEKRHTDMRDGRR